VDGAPPALDPSTRHDAVPLDGEPTWRAWIAAVAVVVIQIAVYTWGLCLLP